MICAHDGTDDIENVQLQAVPNLQSSLSSSKFDLLQCLDWKFFAQLPTAPFTRDRLPAPLARSLDDGGAMLQFRGASKVLEQVVPDIKYEEHVCCRNGCTALMLDETACPKCGEQAYDHQGRPQAVFWYFPLRPRLRLE